MTVRGGRGVERSNRGFAERRGMEGKIMTRPERVDNWVVEGRKIPFNQPIARAGEPLSGVDKTGARDGTLFIRRSTNSVRVAESSARWVIDNLIGFSK